MMFFKFIMHCVLLSNALLRLNERLDDFEHVVHRSSILIGRPLPGRKQRLVQDYEDKKLKELETYCKKKRKENVNFIIKKTPYGKSGWELYDFREKNKTDKLGMYFYDANYLYGTGYLEKREFNIRVIYTDRYHVHCFVIEEDISADQPNEMRFAEETIEGVCNLLIRTFPRVEYQPSFADLSIK